MYILLQEKNEKIIFSNYIPKIYPINILYTKIHANIINFNIFPHPSKKDRKFRNFGANFRPKKFAKKWFFLWKKNIFEICSYIFRNFNQLPFNYWNLLLKIFIYTLCNGFLKKLGKNNFCQKKNNAPFFHQNLVLLHILAYFFQKINIRLVSNI